VRCAAGGWFAKQLELEAAGGGIAEFGGGRPTWLDDAHEVDPRWLEGVKTVALTAGASAPEHLVQELIAALRRLGYDSWRRST